MSKLLNAQNLQRFYANNHAVNNVSIELDQGEILGLLGPNGAGKSSCLQMLCGVLAVNSGSIAINGYDLFEEPNQAKKSIGFLPDTPPIYADLSVNEYLRYAAQLRRIETKKINTAKSEAISHCGLESVKKRLIGNLSKGFQQRVGIAQAIIHQPKVIILDEPTVGLDPIQINEIRKLILALGQQHGIILSTHILPEIHAVCNRVQLIHQGKSVINKSMQELNQNNHVRLQLQSPPALNELQNLSGVESVTQNENGHFILKGQALKTALAQISQHCVTHNWGLLEISLLENNLETLFLNLTNGEDTEAAA